MYFNNTILCIHFAEWKVTTAYPFSAWLHGFTQSAQYFRLYIHTCKNIETNPYI